MKKLEKLLEVPKDYINVFKTVNKNGKVLASKLCFFIWVEFKFKKKSIYLTFIIPNFSLIDCYKVMINTLFQKIFVAHH